MFGIIRVGVRKEEEEIGSVLGRRFLVSLMGKRRKRKRPMHAETILTLENCGLFLFGWAL